MNGKTQAAYAPEFKQQIVELYARGHCCWRRFLRWRGRCSMTLWCRRYMYSRPRVWGMWRGR